MESNMKKLNLICGFAILVALIWFTIFIVHKYSVPSEEDIKQGKIECPTIQKYVDLNTNITRSDLENAVDECKKIARETKQISIQRNYI